MAKNRACDTTLLLDQGGLAYAGLRRILQGMVLALKPKVVVEIGVFRGHSTACLGLSSLELKRRLGWQPKIFAVDPGKYGQRPLVKRYADKADVKFIFKRAQDVNVNEVELPIDILFIDGDHEYEPTKEIFEKWSKWVRPGGIILMHDITVKDKSIKGSDTRKYGVWKCWEEIDMPKITLIDTHPGLGLVMVPRVEEPKEAKKLSVEPEDPTYKEEKPDPIPDFKSGIPDMPGLKEDTVDLSEKEDKPSDGWDAGATDMEKDEPEPKEAYNESESVKAEKSKPKRKYTRKK